MTFRSISRCGPGYSADTSSAGGLALLHESSTIARSLRLGSSASRSGADARRPVIAWTGATADADGGRAVLRHYTAEETLYEWTFVVAPGATTVTAPAMPAEAEDFLPPPTTDGPQEVFRFPEVLFLESDTIPSYASFRQQQGILAPLQEPLIYDMPSLPANGTYRTTSIDHRVD